MSVKAVADIRECPLLRDTRMHTWGLTDYRSSDFPCLSDGADANLAFGVGSSISLTALTSSQRADPGGIQCQVTPKTQ